MNKDLHSQKVEDWNLFVHGLHVYLTYNEGDKVKVRNGYWIRINKYEEEVIEMDGNNVPCEINLNGGNIVCKIFGNGSVEKFDNDGNMNWIRYQGGSEYLWVDGGWKAINYHG